MKIHNILSSLTIILLMANTGCKKGPMDLRSGNPNPNTSVISTPKNTAPVAYAGEDLFLWLPLNEAELSGFYSDNETIKEVSWAKISGPNSYMIENKDSLQTKISGLEKGVYQFELTVTDKMNLYDKDTMAVTVGEISVNPSAPSAPRAYAGQDILVVLPIDFGMLYGGASYIGQPIKSYAWKKISGPSTYILETPDVLVTKVSNLEKGIYEFELTVTDKAGLTGKDTAAVIVGEMSANPKDIIFKDLVWISPWYNNVEIKNFFSNIPSGNIYKIFIQRDYDPEWKEVPSETANMQGNGLYDYFIITRPNGMYNDGSLYISYYGFDVDDTPNVKIVY